MVNKTCPLLLHVSCTSSERLLNKQKRLKRAEMSSWPYRPDSQHPIDQYRLFQHPTRRTAALKLYSQVLTMTTSETQMLNADTKLPVRTTCVCLCEAEAAFTDSLHKLTLL